MRYEVTENGCWNFNGPIGTDGYGKVTFKKETYRAHRFMAHLTIKPLMSDTEIVAHKCDNPRCINPEHLFITTALGNMQDRDGKGRGVHGERSRLTKLSKDEVLVIREKHAQGMSHSKIAALFPIVSQGCIQAIVTRKTWRHL